jgi:hypothetical protein
MLLRLRSILDPFGFETIFDYTGEIYVTFLRLFLTVSYTSGRLEQFADARMV